MIFENIRNCSPVEGLRIDSWETGNDSAGEFLVIKKYLDAYQHNEVRQLYGKSIKVTLERELTNIELIEEGLRGILGRPEALLGRPEALLGRPEALDAAMEVIRKYVPEVK